MRNLTKNQQDSLEMPARLFTPLASAFGSDQRAQQLKAQQAYLE